MGHFHVPTDGVYPTSAFRAPPGTPISEMTDAQIRVFRTDMDLDRINWSKGADLEMAPKYISINQEADCRPSPYRAEAGTPISAMTDAQIRTHRVDLSLHKINTLKQMNLELTAHYRDLDQKAEDELNR